MAYTPQYVKIKEYIIENIKHGNFKPGEKIPSEKNLGDIFNVSRITATTAIRDLVKEGYVYRIQGKGTFVSEKKIENVRNHNAYGFENNSSLNEDVHETKSVRVIKVGSEFSEKMDLTETEELYEIIRYKLDDGKVNAVEYVYLPLKYYPSLKLREVEIGHIHDLVKDSCFLKQKKAKVYIEPVMLDEEQSEILGLDKEKPVLQLEKTTFSVEDKIIEYSRNIINSDIYKFYMDLDLEA
ncbi:GntR family transcriptional regulator [Dethiosulfatibacter aminovorans DSM 17477]|uniref:GntR family transcriptional regulator n=1 Tax=Dethiosulfatibacter aminovorans DSM 17477 TaxID=1121476 RepID=A0A1M6GRJ6_9FIRM|nr:GntR family transcriptional regulator [Dethiosulfatibacter aminovorans]SHJ12594.1 GntR family transcriptional regulator [Dethiosulfatibacter aminovorans DSM 17477]